MKVAVKSVYPAVDLRGNAIGALGLDAVRVLFDALPGVAYFVADRELRFVSANVAMTALCGVRGVEMMLGRRARECFPAEAGEFYEELSHQALCTRAAVTDRIWLSERVQGEPAWFMVGCWPVFEDDHRVVGVTSVARSLESTERKRRAYERVSAATRFISANLASRIRVDDLAHRAGVSVSQIERDFVDVFDRTPVGYIARARLEAAMAMLNSSGVSIAEVAHACGYADQSAFTRRFQASVGMTPSEYRRRMLSWRTKRAD